MVEQKRKEKTTPFGVNLMRSQVLYRAAQEWWSKYTCQKQDFMQGATQDCIDLTLGQTCDPQMKALMNG